MGHSSQTVLNTEDTFPSGDTEEKAADFEEAAKAADRIKAEQALEIEFLKEHIIRLESSYPSSTAAQGIRHICDPRGNLGEVVKTRAGVQDYSAELQKLHRVKDDAIGRPVKDNSYCLE
ncbi:hypothetical protein Pmar_PMAR007313 [Perkinsus marinus ATCC 50983]|uniref:Uncharacterized protein n=1 Tax=Perkinsus marinus (strain ATCC 50983 / TXsc) TaxID=423536 RepID=C5K622_PERM5|nr:hypothetical protein Pmar_PMAR007313 [Perkinsus marinus ATCC 50983]EER20052.1 hypothetical protein Pmar_PMAR007313 [Perkinsus marinus ATCC 50983]|eukprot:XP_002788256.1 hypothetical protein Pmar_PMAR007313 [Perkinsus marinus ATCC 50983]